MTPTSTAHAEPPVAAAGRRSALRNSLPAVYLRTMLDVAAERGIAPEDVLAGSRLTLELLDTPDLRVMARDAAQAMHRAEQLTGAGGFGIEFGLRTMPTAHGYLGYALMTCRTLRESLDLGIHYIHLRERDVSLHLFEQGEQAVLEARDTHQLGPLRPLLHESILIGTYRMIGFVLGEASPQCELWFDWPEPDYYRRYAARIPPARFSMPAIQLRFPRDWLDRRLITADPTAVRQALLEIEREAATLHVTDLGLVERVRAEIRVVRGAYPGLEQVASRLHMSGRTLKRKLGEHGFGFRALLDEKRHRDAMRMLADPDIDIQRIAAALGYQDPPSFTRAFRRWTGATPSAVRQALLGQGAK
jgi:AraC-like DNA-binding protein